MLERNHFDIIALDIIQVGKFGASIRALWYVEFSNQTVNILLCISSLNLSPHHYHCVLILFIFLVQQITGRNFIDIAINQQNTTLSYINHISVLKIIWIWDHYTCPISILPYNPQYSKHLFRLTYNILILSENLDSVSAGKCPGKIQGTSKIYH